MAACRDERCQRICAVVLKLTCLGMGHLGSESEIGIIIVEPQSTETLVGMDFLRKFKKQLVVNPTNGIIEVLPSVRPEENPG